MRLGDVESGDVAEIAIVGFGCDRQRPQALAELGKALEHPLQRGVVGEADREGVGDCDRPCEPASVPDPMGAGHLAVAVQRMYAGPDRIEQVLGRARQNGGHAGMDAAGFILQGREAGTHAGDVGDGIERARRAGQRQPEPARPRSAGGADLRVSRGLIIALHRLILGRCRGRDIRCSLP